MLNLYEITPDTTLGEVTRAFPKSILWFLKQDLDICCGGGETMGNSAARRHTSWQEFHNSLCHYLEKQDVATLLPTWEAGEQGRLIDYILSEFHDKHRELFVQVRHMLAKVCRAHGEKLPNLARLSPTVTHFFEELESHMQKEELVLFPLIRFTCGEPGAQRPSCGPPTAEIPMRVMRDEHVSAGVVLEEIRTLCNDFNPPPWACATMTGLYNALADFDFQLRLHIHLENNVLFPMAEEYQHEMSSTGRL